MSKRIGKGSAETALNTHSEDAASAVGMKSAPISGAARPEIDDAVNDANANANDPIPQLLATIRGEDSGKRTKAAESLVRLGGEAVPTLIEALKDDTPDRVAAGILRQIGEEARCAVPGLIKQFTTGSDLSTRCQAAYALSVLGSVANDAVPTLITAVKDDDITVQCGAARTLGHIGNADSEVISTLVNALGDQDRRIGYAAILALGRIGHTAKDALAIVIATAQRGDPSLRSMATLAMGKVKPASAEIVATLIELLRDENSGVRFNAACAIARFGEKARMAVPVLVEALERPNPYGIAAELLGGIGADARDAVPALIKALTVTAGVDSWQEGDYSEMDRTEAEEWEVGFRRSVVEALGKIGPDAHEAVPALTRILEDQNAGVRESAARALNQINMTELATH